MKNLKSFLNVLKKLNSILNKEQKRRSVWVFATMLICSFLELLGVSIITPFLELMIDEDSLREKWYISWIIRNNDSVNTKELLIFLSLAFVVIYIFKNLFMIYSAYVQTVFASDFNKDNSTRMLYSYP